MHSKNMDLVYHPKVILKGQKGQIFASKQNFLLGGNLMPKDGFD